MAKTSITKKLRGLENVTFAHRNYRDYSPDIKNNLIYCDPPYAKTTGYSLGKFDTDEFWEWVRVMSVNNTVLVSSYEAPDDFECVWQIEKRLGLRDSDGNHKVSYEKLFKMKENK